MKKQTFEERLEKILDAFDDELTEVNPNDNHYEAIKVRYLRDLKSLFLEIIEEAKPKTIAIMYEGEPYDKPNQAIGRNQTIKEYYEALVKKIK